MSILGIARRGVLARLAAVALGLALLPAGSFAASIPNLTQEYDLKAAFLFNFARFVDWPDESFASPASPITIGILGEDPFGKSLDEIVTGEEVRGHKLIVRRYESLEQIESCHILFVGNPLADRMEEVAAKLGKRSILTVGESKGFTEHAGMIGFETAHHRVRLRVNLAAARAARLTISSQLLRQAKIVGPESAP
jgi:hypothetical protein